MKIPQYRKKPGADRDYAFVEWRGKRHRLPGKYDSPESREAYAEFMRTRVFGTPEQQAAPARISLQKMFGVYLDWAVGYYQPTIRGWEFETLETTLQTVGNMHECEIAAEDFSPVILKRVQRNLVELGHSRLFVNTETSRIRRVFRWAVSEGLIPGGVVEGLRCVEPLRYGRSKARETRPVTAVDEDVFLETLAYMHPVVSDLFSVLWYTGVRCDSACQAAPEQFDFRSTPWIWRPHHKTEYLGKEILIPIGPQCQKILERRLVGVPDGTYLFLPAQAAQRKRSNPSPRFTSVIVLRQLVKAIERANKVGHDIPPWHTHQIRHAHAERVDRMFGREAARTALAHSNVNTTAIYVARDLELATKVAMQLG